MNCPKCGRPMEEGTLHTHKYPFWTQEELRFFNERFFNGAPDSGGSVPYNIANQFGSPWFSYETRFRRSPGPCSAGTAERSAFPVN